MSTSDAGTTPLAILWTMTAITMVFLALRLISRYHIVEEFGWDDYVYSISAVSKSVAADDFKIGNVEALRDRYFYSFTRVSSS